MRDSAPITVQALGKEVSPTRAPTASTTPDRVTPVPPGAPDLALVGVEAIVAGEKGGVPFCNTRVTYRNAGTLAIPRNFAVQFAFNGTPVFTNTVAGGLPPGATADLTFVYQFEGTQYIGINLDVGNAIAESDEANNVFAEARMCGAPRTISPTPVVTLTPTRTPTSGLPPASCVGTPNITSFSASPASILVGQSATLSWGSVTNAESVSLEPGLGGVASPGSRSVSPNTTTTYTLVARCGSNSISRQATVSVTSLPIITIVPTRTPTRTPTKPSDTQGPPAPSLVAPKGNLSCRTSVTLDWNAVSDPSGIKQYIVKWTRNDGQTGGTVTTNTQHTISVSCNRSYTWSVQAVDNADNPGATGSASFTIQEGVY